MKTYFAGFDTYRHVTLCGMMKPHLSAVVNYYYCSVWYDRLLEPNEMKDDAWQVDFRTSRE